MKYVVVWDAAAEHDLTKKWLASRTRHAMRSAADKIDAALQADPHECGESRDTGRRMMFEWPLGVLFEVDEAQRRVRVVSVWEI